MNTFDQVKQTILASLPDAIVEIVDLTGTQDHLGIKVVSDAFKGKALLAQHRMIMDILKDDLKNKIHAVKIQTMTNEKYQAEKKS